MDQSKIPGTDEWWGGDAASSSNVDGKHPSSPYSTMQEISNLNNHGSLYPRKLSGLGPSPRKARFQVSLPEVTLDISRSSDLLTEPITDLNQHSLGGQRSRPADFVKI